MKQYIFLALWLLPVHSWADDPVSAGDLQFLAEPPQKPVLHSLNVLTVRQDSIQNGWVRLEQCYQHLDAVPDAEVVYRYKSMRDLRITSHRNIQYAQVQEQSVQLKNITAKAELCIEAEARIFYANENGSFSLINGPFHRKFLDGYFPYHVTLKIVYPAQMLEVIRTKPAAQTGFTVQHSKNTLYIESHFQGILNTEIIFQPR